jgi:hypothetical protein
MILAIAVGIILEGLIALYALKWALPKSNKAFFGIFAGDALLRLVGLGLATWWLWSKQLPFVAPLLTIGFGYLAVSLVQIPFLYKAQAR